jgi:hypothetical protein
MADKITEDTIKKLIEEALKEDRRDLLEERTNFTYKKLPYDITGHKTKVKTALGTTTSGGDIAKVAGIDNQPDKLNKKDFEDAFELEKNDAKLKIAADLYTKSTNDKFKSHVKPVWDASTRGKEATAKLAKLYYQPDGYSGNLSLDRRIKLGTQGKITFSGVTFVENLKRAKWLLTNSTKPGVTDYLNAMMNDTRTVGEAAKAKSTDGKDGEVIKMDGLRAIFNLAQTLVLNGDLESNNANYKKIQAAYKSSTRGQLTPKDTTDRGGLKRQTITAPEISTVGIESGQMLRSQFEMFDTFIQANPGSSDDAANQLETRIKALTKFTADLFNEPTTISEVATNPVEGESVYLQFLNKTMIMDYFNKMALEMDSMAGAYTFEAFCAYLAGGVSGGKVAGLGGKMGATDFSFADGSKGSAKYLANKNTFTQSAKDFVVGEGVTYIFASKRGEDSATTTSDPGKIYSIEMYVGTVVRTSETDRSKITINGTAVTQSDPDNYTFKADDFTDAGTLYLRTSDGDVITNNLQSLSTKIDNDQGEFFKLFKDTMADLLSAKDSIEIYANKGTTLDGVAASGKLKSADSNFGKFRTAMQKAPAVVTEQKITANSLKKLISESFKR